MFKLFYKKINYKIILVFLIVGVTLWTIGYNDPYVGSYSANENYISLGAKNYIRFGILRLHFLPTYYAGETLPDIPPFYLHHPFLQYLITSLAFRVFGFHHWVVRFVPFIYSLGSLFFIYLIGKSVWNRKVGILASVIASLMPMMTIFGTKLVMFEHATLFWVLGVFYNFLRFTKTKKDKYLISVAIFSVGGILTDWGILYLMPGFLFFFLLMKKKSILKAIYIYLLISFLGVSLFLVLVFYGKGNFNDLLNIIIIRVSDKELFGLSFPYLRLSLIIILRLIIYFIPLIVLFTFLQSIDLIKRLFQKKLDIKVLTLLVFFLLGLVNIIIVPANTWAHIYFLFYWIPFFSFSGALRLVRFSNKPFIIYLLLFSMLAWSSGVTYFKWRQRTKQIWRFDAALRINSSLKPYEEIAVRGFPGDVFEQYFFHPTFPSENYNELLDWLNQGKAGEKKIVFSCWDTCTNEDNEFLESMPYKITKFDRVWLIENSEVNKTFTMPESKQGELPAKLEKQSALIKLYRFLRDKLGVGQL